MLNLDINIFKDASAYKQFLQEQTHGKENESLMSASLFGFQQKQAKAKLLNEVNNFIQGGEKLGYIDQSDAAIVRKFKARAKVMPQPLISPKGLIVGGLLASGLVAGIVKCSMLDNTSSNLPVGLQQSSNSTQPVNQAHEVFNASQSLSIPQINYPKPPQTGPEANSSYPSTHDAQEHSFETAAKEQLEAQWLNEQLEAKVLKGLTVADLEKIHKIPADHSQPISIEKQRKLYVKTATSIKKVWMQALSSFNQTEHKAIALDACRARVVLKDYIQGVGTLSAKKAAKHLDQLRGGPKTCAQFAADYKHNSTLIIEKAGSPNGGVNAYAHYLDLIPTEFLRHTVIDLSYKVGLI